MDCENSRLLACLLIDLIYVELPWDQPSYQNPEYKRWLDRDYYHNPWKKIDNMILSTTFDVLWLLQNKIQFALLDLLRRILIHDPAQRARVPDIQSHKWMLKVYPQGRVNQPSLIKKSIFVRNRWYRIGSSIIKTHGVRITVSARSLIDQWSI